jgi:hypothetical protein
MLEEVIRGGGSSGVRADAVRERKLSVLMMGSA